MSISSGNFHAQPLTQLQGGKILPSVLAYNHSQDLVPFGQSEAS